MIYKVFLTILALTSFESFAQNNLIRNGGFEFDGSDWTSENILIINPYDKHSGEKSGNIIEYTSPSWKGIDQTFSIPKNTAALQVSAWLKVDGVEKGKSEWNKAVMILEINGKGESIVSLDGTTSWSEYKKIIPINKDRSARLMFALSECTGIFYFDDVKVNALSQNDYNKLIEEENKKYEVKVITDATPLEILKLTNSGFETGLQGWRGIAEVSSEEKNSGTFSLKLNSNQPVWYGVDQIADIPADAKTMDVSAFAKTNNLKPGKNEWNKGVMIVEFTKNTSSKTGEDQPVFFISDVKDWQKFSKTLSIPEGAEKYRVMLALSEAIGTMYVDDIQVKFNN
ncbi:hypothetical protein [Kaistella montana]|uniref:CBM-cenC domain-containing protein n=1 Tax=Kaistella montana TaxID=1849733 RepID=A0ABW5K9M3_9FLAO|nr:hypothetical protein [Kaistella montana]MCQ4035125.1 hypothetical protein [Kaistella montana]